MEAAQLRLLPHHVESAHRRSQRLMAEARQAADDQIADLRRVLGLLAELANDVGQGGDVYPVGVRDLAAKIAGDAAWCGLTIQVIMRHTGRAPAQEQDGAA